jgi:tight adherence protein B
LRRFQIKERLAALLEQAGLKWHPARLLHGCMAAFLAGAVLALNALPPAYRSWAPLPGLVTGSIPLLYVLRKRRKRLRKFEEQFPDSLDFIARSMRAGHAFSVSLEMVHTEFEEPLAGEFRRVFEEQNLGLPLEMALEKMAQRVPSMDVHFFVSAVLLQKRTGGNLAELLEKLAGLIRERFKLRGRIRAISAHGRMTGTVLSLIPAAVTLIMFYVNPSYVMFFVQEPLGHQMAAGAILLQLLGFAIIKKIVTIET